MFWCFFFFFFVFFFFFKQKTAYEIMPSLVGSEMCIRDSPYYTHRLGRENVDLCSTNSPPSTDNPLRGANLSSIGPRFPDLSDAYNKGWRQKALGIAAEFGVKPQEGVYAAMSGPNYESPAEIRFLRTIGADMVGMSTVPEVIVANHGGIQVMGISCVTNMAAGILGQKLSHVEVMQTAARIEKQFVHFVQALVKVL